MPLGAAAVEAEGLRRCWGLDGLGSLAVVGTLDELTTAAAFDEDGAAAGTFVGASAALPTEVTAGPDGVAVVGAEVGVAAVHAAGRISPAAAPFVAAADCFSCSWAGCPEPGATLSAAV